MIGSKLYRRQFLIAALSVLACVLVGTSAIGVIVRLTMPPPEEQKLQTPRIFVNFVEEEFAGDYGKAIEKLQHYLGAGDPMHLFLLDENGATIFPAGAHAPRVDKLPQVPHEPMRLAGHGPGMVTRLNHEPARYLVEVIDAPFGAPGPGHPPFPGDHPGPPPPGMPGPWFFPLSFLATALMVLVGLGIGLAIIFRSLRNAGIEADGVISELRRGNLKARFPIRRHDEIGAAMQRFNSMADEIEKLVDRLRTAESSRNSLLQELTHDLRTPVASLRTILEGLFRSVKLDPEEAEMANLAEREVEYLGKLVEDLLLLAQLTEPKFKASRGLVDLLTMIEDECEAVERKRESSIKMSTRFETDQALVPGDEHLFQRLLRNTLENAHSYAKSRVQVDVSRDQNGDVRIRVSDDGEGFSPEALAKFGERRESRSVHKTRGGKLSLGLGSVIMKSVVTLHGGQISARNGPAGGAVVEITLPARV